MKRYRAHVVVLALYTLLALGLTWPLAAHLSTHIPGSGQVSLSMDGSCLDNTDRYSTTKYGNPSLS